MNLIRGLITFKIGDLKKTLQKWNKINFKSASLKYCKGTKLTPILSDIDFNVGKFLHYTSSLQNKITEIYSCNP